MTTSCNAHALDSIDAELAEIEALVACTRLLWETIEFDGIEEIRSMGVTLSFVVTDKIRTAQKNLLAARVYRVRAGRGSATERC